MSTSENAKENTKETEQALTFVGTTLKLDQFIIKGLQQKTGKDLLTFKVIARSNKGVVVSCDVISASTEILPNAVVGDLLTIDGNGVVVEEKLVDRRKQKRLSKGSGCSLYSNVKMR